MDNVPVYAWFTTKFVKIVLKNGNLLSPLYVIFQLGIGVKNLNGLSDMLSWL